MLMSSSPWRKMSIFNQVMYKSTQQGAHIIYLSTYKARFLYIWGSSLGSKSPECSDHYSKSSGRKQGLACHLEVYLCWMLSNLETISDREGRGYHRFWGKVWASASYPSLPGRTTIQNVLTWHWQRRPPVLCQTFSRSGLPVCSHHYYRHTVQYVPSQHYIRCIAVQPWQMSCSQ